MVVYKQQSQEILTRLSDIWFALIDMRCLFVTTRIRQKAVVQMQNKRKLNLLSVKLRVIWSPLRKIIDLVPYLRTCLNKVSPLSVYKKMTH